MQWTIKLEARTGWGDTETCEIGTVSRGVTGKSAGDVGLLSWMKRRPFSPNCSVAWDRVASRIAGPSDGTALSIAQTVRIYFGRPNPSIVLGVMFERHGGYPDDEWDHPAPTGHRPPTSAGIHATPSHMHQSPSGYPCCRFCLTPVPLVTSPRK
jgi:hypothetical protein